MDKKLVNSLPSEQDVLVIKGVKNEGINSINSNNNNSKEEILNLVIKCPVDILAKEFIKDYQIIWHDQSINSSQNQGYARNIEHYYHHPLEKFEFWDKAVELLKRNTTTQSFIIISGIIEERLVNEANGLSHVRGIYLLCGNTQEYSTWAIKYSKIVFVNSNFSALLKALNEHISAWQKKNSTWRANLPLFKLLSPTSGINSLTMLCSNLDRLACIGSRNQAMKDFLRLCKAVNHDTHYILQFQKAYTKYDMDAILHWYMKDCFFYKTISNSLRIHTLDPILYCRLMINDLQQAIRDYYQKKSKNFYGIVYKGILLSHDELLEFQSNIGKDIQIYGFILATKSRNIAQNLSKNALLTIIIPGTSDRLGRRGFAELRKSIELGKNIEIRKNSDHGNDQEEDVLFNIMSSFRVLSVTKDKRENGSQYSNIVLLYEAHEMKKHVYKSEEYIDLEIKDPKKVICSKCQAKFTMKKNFKSWFINLKDQAKWLCHSCLKEKNLTDEDVLLMVSTNEFLSKTKRIKGFFMKSLIPKYYHEAGLKCTKCRVNQIYPGLSFSCITCKTSNFLLCSQCLNKCSLINHMRIVHLNNLNFWFETMTHSEFMYSELLDGNLFELENITQGKLFANNHDMAIKYYEGYIAKTMSNQLIAACCGNIGLLYSNKEDYDKAIEWFKRSIELNQEVCLDKTETYVNMGNAYYAIGDYEKAVEWFTKALKMHRELFGEEHSGTAAGYSNIGDVCDIKEDYDKAIKNFTRALKIHKELLGERHPGTAACYNSIGLVYSHKGEYDKAIKNFTKSLKIRQERLGVMHILTAGSYNNIGLAYNHKGEYDKAIKNYTKSLKIRMELLGVTHPSIASSYNNIGLAYDSEGEYDNAMGYFIKSLEMHKTLLGDIHPNTAASYNNIGLVYNHKGEYDKAIEHFLKALEINEELIIGKMHMEIAACCNNIGSSYARKEEYDKAIDWFMKTVKIRQELLGDNHPLTTVALSNIARVYLDKGEDDKAMEYYEKLEDLSQN